MAFLVQKFGGTSLGSSEKVRQIADHLQRRKLAGDRLVVVVSAMGETTDQLFDLASRVSKRPARREMDMLLTAGERISMALLSMALADRGVQAISFTGSQSGIITCAGHGRARIQEIKAARVERALEEGKVAIVAGFQGVSEAKEVTTLGRGGSDTTAVALAAVLGADACEIYTDVAGVFSADPRWVPEAKLWQELSYQAALGLAGCGAQVLHPRSVSIAQKYGVRVRVADSEHPEKAGTWIAEVGKGVDVEEFKVVGVVSDREKLGLEVRLAEGRMMPKFYERIDQKGLEMMQPTWNSEGRVWTYIDQSAKEDWQAVHRLMEAEGLVQSFEFYEDRVPVTVAGVGSAQSSRLFQKVFTTLEKEAVPVYFGTATAVGLTFGVPRELEEKAVAALHQALME